jgi:Uma2 family endonuclease
MSEAYDWSWLKREIPVIDMDLYLSMPEDLAHAVEVRDGMLVHCESPSPNHIAVQRAIEQAFREAVRKRSPDEPCIRASGDVDMLVSEAPFTYRRPDAIVYRCVEHDRGRWKRKPAAADALLVVEVVSQGTVSTDGLDKRLEYARLGIPQYWIVRMENDDGRVKSIEMLQLTSDGTYITAKVCLRSHDPGIAAAVAEPLDVSISWSTLDADIE